LIFWSSDLPTTDFANLLVHVPADRRTEERSRSTTKDMKWEQTGGKRPSARESVRNTGHARDALLVPLETVGPRFRHGAAFMFVGFSSVFVLLFFGPLGVFRSDPLFGPFVSFRADKLLDMASVPENPTTTALNYVTGMFCPER
jgi:hypothetical protein